MLQSPSFVFKKTKRRDHIFLKCKQNKWSSTNFERTLRERVHMYLSKMNSPFQLIRSAAAVKSLQSYPTLCHPIDGSPPGSPIPGILQARTLEWVAISFSNAWKWKVKGKSLSHVQLFTTPWTAAHQAPPSMGFSRQECWSWVPLPSPGTTLSTLNSLSHLTSQHA